MESGPGILCGKKKELKKKKRRVDCEMVPPACLGSSSIYNKEARGEHRFPKIEETPIDHRRKKETGKKGPA